MTTIILFIIRLYTDIVSPLLHQVLGIQKGLGCRYEVSCSVYAVQVIQRYGILRGSLKSIRRLLTCQPFFHGKYI